MNFKFQSTDEALVFGRQHKGNKQVEAILTTYLANLSNRIEVLKVQGKLDNALELAFEYQFIYEALEEVMK